jgi:hypothetical protein
MPTPLRYAWSHRGIRVSIGITLVLLVWDAAISGSFLMSCLFCPIWFFCSIVKNTIQRTGWRLTLLRLAFPPLTLGLVLVNNTIQLNNAEENAARIIAACEEFHTANGRFPKTLDELVPQHVPSIPRAKYCLVYGEFMYWYNEGSQPFMFWYKLPPYGRKTYRFEERRGGYID